MATKAEREGIYGYGNTWSKLLKKTARDYGVPEVLVENASFSLLSKITEIYIIANTNNKKETETNE